MSSGFISENMRSKPMQTTTLLEEMVATLCKNSTNLHIRAPARHWYVMSQTVLVSTTKKSMRKSVMFRCRLSSVILDWVIWNVDCFDMIEINTLNYSFLPLVFLLTYYFSFIILYFFMFHFFVSAMLSFSLSF